MDQLKKAEIRSELNEYTPSFENGDAAFEAWSAVVVVAYTNKEVAEGIMAWRVSARLRRWREAPCPEAAMRCSENGGRQRVLARPSGGGAKRTAMGRCSNQSAKKGADPAPSGGGDRP